MQWPGGLDIFRANHELSSKYNRIDNQIKVLCFVCVRPLFIFGEWSDLTYLCVSVKKSSKLPTTHYALTISDHAVCEKSFSTIFSVMCSCCRRVVLLHFLGFNGFLVVPIVFVTV